MTPPPKKSKSLLVRRSIYIGPRKSTAHGESLFWTSLKEIAETEKLKLGYFPHQQRPRYSELVLRDPPVRVGPLSPVGGSRRVGKDEAVIATIEFASACCRASSAGRIKNLYGCLCSPHKQEAPGVSRSFVSWEARCSELVAACDPEHLNIVPAPTVVERQRPSARAGGETLAAPLAAVSMP